MKAFRSGRKGALWYTGCVLSLVFLCVWEYFTIAMGAPWFFPLIGGAMLCVEALELAGALLARRRVNGAEEAQDDAEPLARARALAAAAMRLVVLLFLLAWTGATTYIALTAQTSPLIWFFPAVGLVMLAFFIATGGALRGEGGRTSAPWALRKRKPDGDAPDRGGQPPRARVLRAMMPGLLLALLGLMFAIVWLTVVMPEGVPWATCLVPFAVAAVGVASAIANARKASKNDAADALPRTCPRCEATVPAGESVCPRCGKRVRAGRTREMDAGT